MARRTIVLLLLMPLLMVMVSKDPQGAAAGVAGLVRVGAELLGRTADAVNQFLAALAG